MYLKLSVLISIVTLVLFISKAETKSIDRKAPIDIS